MDVTIYVPTIEVWGEQMPTTIGFAQFDLMGKAAPVAESLPSLDPRLLLHLTGIIKNAERVWVGPNMEAAIHLYGVLSLSHPQLRDAETLFSFIPHLPYEYPRGGSPKDCARTMALRIRSCVDALFTSNL